VEGGKADLQEVVVESTYLQYLMPEIAVRDAWPEIFRDLLIA